MNRKNSVCILLSLIAVLCFASAAGADYNPYQSTCNPYANAYGGYAPSSTQRYVSSNQKIIDCPPDNGTQANAYASSCGNTRQNACYPSTSHSYYAKGYACATGDANASNRATDYGSCQTLNCYARPYCTPQSTPQTPEQNTPQGQDDGYYTPGTLTSQEQILVDMINHDRKNNGLNALSVDLALVSLARQKSLDMIQNGYFAHESPTYGNAANMLSDAGYPYQGVGENIAKNASTEKAHAALMSSDGHRKNILGSQWTKMGVGIVNDFNGYPYITELFVR